MRQYILPGLIVFLTCFLTIGNVFAENNKQIIIAGWLERVVLSPWQILLKAKLDTGAKTSSIHSENIEKFERDDQPWVRFSLPKGRGKKSKRHIIEAPLAREVAIKRHNLPSKIRPVVKLAFCINDYYYETEFTLADRDKFNYPVLLGRRFLKDNILVDSSIIFSHDFDYKKNSCKPEKEEPSKEMSLIRNLTASNSE